MNNPIGDLVTRIFLAAFLVGTSALASQALTPLISPFSGQWQLVAMNDVDVVAQFMLDTTESSRFSGNGPCNLWSAQTGDALPSLSFGPILSTRMACPDLAVEGAILTALAAMTQVHISADDRLEMAGADGQTLRFVRKAAQ